MVFGTFDGLHKGHENFFKQARKLSKRPFLIVSVARDLNVKRIKGKNPLFGEKQRAARVRKSKLAEKVVLGGLHQHLDHIFRQKPDIIALGYDQKAYVRELKADIRRGILKVKIVKLKSFKPKIYKSSLIHAHRNRGGKGE